MITKILVDGDILAYQVAFGIQRVMWDDTIGGNVLVAIEQEVHQAINDVIAKYKKELFADEVMVALTDSENNFRKTVYSEYKKNRVDIDKPIALQKTHKHPNGMVKEYLLDKYKAVILPYLEADDVISIEATSYQADVKKIIVSIDKDFEQCGGCYLYNPDHDLEPRYIEPEVGKLFFLSQVIAGDRTDNFKGIEGIGMIKAERYLKQEGATWDNVVALYKENDMTETDAITNARCAWLLRQGQYIYPGAVTLWEPEDLNYGS
jgi:DNA polymerase-1